MQMSPLTSFLVLWPWYNKPLYLVCYISGYDRVWYAEQSRAKRSCVEDMFPSLPDRIGPVNAFSIVNV